jgi:hypothetical protein
MHSVWHLKSQGIRGQSGSEGGGTAVNQAVDGDDTDGENLAPISCDFMVTDNNHLGKEGKLRSRERGGQRGGMIDDQPLMGPALFLTFR